MSLDSVWSALLATGAPSNDLRSGVVFGMKRRRVFARQVMEGYPRLSGSERLTLFLRLADAGDELFADIARFAADPRARLGGSERGTRRNRRKHGIADGRSGLAAPPRGDEGVENGEDVDDEDEDEEDDDDGEDDEGDEEEDDGSGEEDARDDKRKGNGGLRTGLDRGRSTRLLFRRQSRLRSFWQLRTRLMMPHERFFSVAASLRGGVPFALDVRTDLRASLSHLRTVLARPHPPRPDDAQVAASIQFEHESLARVLSTESPDDEEAATLSSSSSSSSASSSAPSSPSSFSSSFSSSSVPSAHSATPSNWRSLVRHSVRRLRRLDDSLRMLFASQLAVSLREIRFDTAPPAVLEFLRAKEAVHPFSGVDDLRRRLGGSPGRFCFGLFHPHLPYEPLVFVAIATLADRDLATLHSRAFGSAESESVHPSTPDAVSDGSAPPSSPSLPPLTPFDPTTAVEPVLRGCDLIDFPDPSSPPTTALYYSVTNTRAEGLQGLNLASLLLYLSMERLARRIPTLRRFITLSPVPKFRGWLDSQLLRRDRFLLTPADEEAIRRTERLLRGSEVGEDDSGGHSPESPSVPTPIASAVSPAPAPHTTHVPTSDAFVILGEWLQGSEWWKCDLRRTTLHPLLLRWAARFILFEREGTRAARPRASLPPSTAAPIGESRSAPEPPDTRRRSRPRMMKAADPVANFHAQNGAALDRINFLASTAARWMRASYGVFVNYRYSSVEQVGGTASARYRRHAIMAASRAAALLILDTSSPAIWSLESRRSVPRGLAPPASDLATDVMGIDVRRDFLAHLPAAEVTTTPVFATVFYPGDWLRRSEGRRIGRPSAASADPHPTSWLSAAAGQAATVPKPVPVADVYFIVTGEVDLVEDEALTAPASFRLGPGAVFGALPILLRRRPRFAARARTRVEALVLPGVAFLALLERHSRLSERLVRAIESQLRASVVEPEAKL